MATGEHVTEWSTTAACTPAGSDSIGATLDDELRQLKATVYSTARLDEATKSAAYTSTILDFNTVISAAPGAGTLTVSLAAAATVGEGWRVTVRHAGTAQGVLIDGAGTETLAGSLTYSLTQPGECIDLVSNGTNGWFLAGATIPTSTYMKEVLQEETTASASSKLGGAFPSGTRMLFQQTDAPTGWTKDTTAALDDVALRLTTGTVGTSTGNDAFTTVFGASVSTDGFTLTNAELPTEIGAGNTSTATAGGSTFIATGVGSTGIQNASGGNAHAHGMTMNLDYYDAIVASKD